ncbi:hypothetical protein FYJ43_07495 [Cutibacterium sp. WCA-380-WT-3A]|uniref:Uncharacterized protein n=1 Tax=Cutibacterium porci TaxID=2605781 RepID=A0A7K0J7S8_9ACTN|nr:hypothetical protein [Cutibacterium porci]
MWTPRTFGGRSREVTRAVDPHGSGGCVVPSRGPLYPQHALHTERLRFSVQRNMGRSGDISQG